jgi:uncharacterized RDD family membrane protein YckC
LEGIPLPANVLDCGHMAAELAPVMKSRFQPDADSAPRIEPALIDPEAFDVSEQQFAASLEEKSAPRPRFVLEDSEADGAAASPGPNHTAAGEVVESSRENGSLADSSSPPDPDSWRREVADRVNHYRGRRPREPRYPSLQLRFESNEPAMMVRPSDPVAPTSGQLAITMDPEPAQMAEPQASESSCDDPTPALAASAAKILSFPRSSFMPPVVAEELAEPVFDRPRILEVPEVLPPPPALGGILIEPPQEAEDDRRPGFELPLKSASLSRRILAGMTDAMVVATAFAAFAYIFFRITSIVPPLRQGAGVGAGLLAGFWVAYQYLLLVHAGSTPGLRLARLELTRFDGRAVPQRVRRWRVLASALSGLSLALGYVWCFMDEDELCWHDRITHTYMAPKAPKAEPPVALH